VSSEAPLPCIVCGSTLDNVTDDSVNQPSGGTEFATFGHYGSTFWDSFDGEQIVINICDECLQKNAGRIGRQKRYVTLVVDDPRGTVSHPLTIGRQWVTRELVPWFDGPEDNDRISVEPEEIGNLPSYDRVEWVRGWRDIKRSIMRELGEQEGTGDCKHVRFVAECLNCGAKPLEGLR
jgi:hypothetical protein